MDDLISQPMTQGRSDNTLAGGGEMGHLMRAQNWQTSPFGTVEQWPQSLRTAVSMCLTSRFPIILFWGRDLRQFYNDAYRPILGQTKHPYALGQRAQECWPEIWDVIGPMLNGVMTTGEATWSENQLLLLDRNGYVEECYFTFSYSPIRDESGEVGGVFCAVTETTAEVLNTRRLRTLRALAANTAQAKTIEEVCQIAIAMLADQPADMPFSLLYILDVTRNSARLVGTTGILAGTIASPLTIALTSPDATWPLSEIVDSGKPELIENLTQRFGDSWSTFFQQEQPVSHQALILPIARAGETQPYGFLVAGINPRCLLDSEYRGFLTLLAGQIAAAVTAARAYQEAQERAEALAELDRAKTTFFSNISHEFRTPLTLLLGPLDAVLSDPKCSLDDEYRVHLEMVRRNALRQLKLVNMLLDFSRIEAGRMQAVYVPTDLDALTFDLASLFRSAIEAAKLRFIVECPSLSEPVYVDREMWEKIVLNLLSNAFKFTFEGQIQVSLKIVDDMVVLSIADTGIGINADDLPHLFERFYQATLQRSRTQEGSGIGLSLVQELVRLHGGTIEVSSVVGKGTTFTVRLPRGKAHLPPSQIGTIPPLSSNAIGALAYVEEAERWLPQDQKPGGVNKAEDLPQEGLTPRKTVKLTENATARVLIVDDNADMRDYLEHLLAPFYTLQVAADGYTALHIARVWYPDLILSDVMMPGLDGFALLSAIRADPLLYAIPLIFLSARAGEEATIEGLQVGADDYLVKPFSARELLARVKARLEIAHLRREVIINSQQWEAAFEGMADGILLYDANGTVLSINAALRNLFGIDFASNSSLLSMQECMAHILMRDERGEPLAEDAWPQWRVLRGEVLTGEQSVDLTLQTLDGRERQISMTGAPIYNEWGDVSRALCIVRDVTESRRIEAERLLLLERERAALAEAETAHQHLYDLFMQAPAFICVLRGPQHIFELANPLYLQLVGHRDLIGLPFRQALPELDAQGLCEQLDHVYTTGEPFIGNEVQVLIDRKNDGQLEDGYFNFVYQASRTAHGEVDGILLHGVEVTELVLARQRVDTFLGIASHELRSPLTSIKGNVQLAMRWIARITRAVNDREASGQPLDEVQSMLERGLRQIDFLNRLVGDLVDVARIQAEKLELRIAPANLSMIVREVVEEQRHMTPTRAIHLTLPKDEPPLFMIDAERIAQVVMNYLSNALKYSEAEKAVFVHVSQVGPTMRIAITDEGPGLSTEKQEHIWDRFYRVPDVAVKSGSGVGLGLGLYICRTIVEQHGGQVGVESIEGQGSTFWFTLPIAEQ